ncbi:hypothetical protein NORO109296_13260 [Nocardiopsis rhodophaea]
MSGRQGGQATVGGLVDGLGARFGVAQAPLGVLLGLRAKLLGLLLGRADHLVGLGAGGGDDALGVLVGLLDPLLGFLLGLLSDLVDLFVDFGALVLSFFLGDPQDRGHALADLLVLGLDRGLLLGLGQLTPELLQFVVRSRQPLLEVADLVVVADDEIVDLALVVTVLSNGREGFVAE